MGSASVLLMTQAPASAQDPSLTLKDFELPTVESLRDICDAETSTILGRDAVLFCLGFIEGAMHYHDALARGPDFEEIVCPEGEVTRDDVKAVFIQWAKANPDMKDKQPVEGLVESAVAKWPCS